MTTEEEIIAATKIFVKTTLQHAEGGHDWWHIERVLKNTLLIAKTEKVYLFVVTLAALLHDIADSKFNNGDENLGPAKATAFLQSIEVSESVIAHVENIIRNISFKGGNFARRVLFGGTCRGAGCRQAGRFRRHWHRKGF